MQWETQSLEDDLLELAAASRRVANTIGEPAIYLRLIEIADELTEMAGDAHHRVE